MTRVLARALWTAGLPLALVLASVPCAAAAPPATVEFAVPAQAGGNVSVGGLQWALLVFDPGAGAQFHFDLPAGGTSTNHTVGLVTARQPGRLDVHEEAALRPQAEPIPGRLDADVGLGGTWSSLLVEAESLHLQANGSQVELRRSEDGQLKQGHLPMQGEPPATFRGGDATVPDGMAFGLAPAPGGPLAFSLAATGVRRVEWHNATVACPASQECPDGARTFGVDRHADGFAVLVAPFFEVRGSGGALEGGGTVLAVAAGGPQVDLVADGWGRFPAASLAGRCEGSACPDPAGRTLQVEGRFVLAGLGPLDGDPGRVRSGFGGALTSASFDEHEAFSLVGKAALGGAALLGALLAAKILLGLFARRREPGAQNARTKALHDLIRSQPGLSFVGLKRATGWGHGTVHYHLALLQRQGQVVAYTYGKRARYFENHRRHEKDWREHAALRSAGLRELHGWLSANPECTQADVLRAASAWGWTRSTTQRNLGLLREARLLAAQRRGRSIAYTAMQAVPLAEGQAPAGAAG